MINALDETLKALLRRDLPSALAEQVQISFATPDDQFPPQSVTLPAIDLFLDDVRENLDLRSNEVYLERRGNGTAIQTRAPVRVDFSYLIVDFSYLITAWPSQNSQVACRALASSGRRSGANRRQH
ncbi:MAG TPA: Pvc16 family protein [Candidatus Binatia bacterium]|nr:Pvc16 family protein [Candidatus Binatia bacterium]